MKTNSIFLKRLIFLIVSVACLTSCSWLGLSGDPPLEITITTVPIPGYLAWSPDGQQIAFSSDHTGNFEIFTIDLNSLAITNLTNHPAADRALPFVSWSPDGKSIVFTSNRDAKTEIYTMNADGSQQKRLTDDRRTNFSPVWSPNGQQIAFLSDFSDRTKLDYQVYVMNADGSAQMALTRMDKRSIYFSWSPDNHSLTYTTGESNNWEVHLINLNSGEDQTLMKRLACEPYPAWSPDGEHIVFESCTGTILLNVATGQTEELDMIPALSWYQWSPNGRSFLLTIDQNNNEDVYLFHIDTNQLTRLTKTVGEDEYQPIWSPDGQKIAFWSTVTGNLDRYLYLMNSDGSDLQLLSTIRKSE